MPQSLGVDYLGEGLKMKIWFFEIQIPDFTLSMGALYFTISSYFRSASLLRGAWKRTKWHFWFLSLKLVKNSTETSSNAQSELYSSSWFSEEIRFPCSLLCNINQVTQESQRKRDSRNHQLRRCCTVSSHIGETLPHRKKDSSGAGASTHRSSLLLLE